MREENTMRRRVTWRVQEHVGIKGVIGRSRKALQSHREGQRKPAIQEAIQCEGEDLKVYCGKNWSQITRPSFLLPQCSHSMLLRTDTRPLVEGSRAIDNQRTYFLPILFLGRWESEPVGSVLWSYKTHPPSHSSPCIYLIEINTSAHIETFVLMFTEAFFSHDNPKQERTQMPSASEGQIWISCHAGGKGTTVSGTGLGLGVSGLHVPHERGLWKGHGRRGQPVLCWGSRGIKAPDPDLEVREVDWEGEFGANKWGR